METTSAFKVDYLTVPGASLYYEVRGAGPVLLMMPGGPADAATFRKIESELGKHYTVVTYDPRNLSHSKLDEPLDDARMVQTFADDVHRLLNQVAGSSKADVFASSGGAVIALELAARHPEQLGTVICHEPPSPALLDDAAAVRAAMEHVCDTCASAGLFAAMQEFGTLIGAQGGPPPAPDHEPTTEEKEAQALMMGNMDFFFGRYIRSIARYEPEFELLRTAQCRVVPAIGKDSAGQLAHNGGIGLGRALNTPVAVFPGDHGGFAGHPTEFAAKLLQVLEA